MLDVVQESLPLFVAEVVPILQERGLYRRKYTGTTLPGASRPAHPALVRQAKLLHSHQYS